MMYPDDQAPKPTPLPWWLAVIIGAVALAALYALATL
jgi:hypothetical protein